MNRGKKGHIQKNENQTDIKFSINKKCLKTIK